MASPSARPSPAVERAAAVLERLSDLQNSQALSLSDLARHLKCPKSSIANICAALESARLIRQDPTGRGYQLGRATLELGGAYLRSVDSIRSFYEGVRDYPNLRCETVQLAVREGSGVIYLAQHYGDQPIKLSSMIGGRLPAHCTATGKALLAELSNDEVADMYDGLILEAPTGNGHHGIDDLLADLDAIRTRGYAVDDEETALGVVCLAVAISQRSSSHGPLAVSTTYFQHRDDPSLRETLITDLNRFTKELVNPLQPTARNGA